MPVRKLVIAPVYSLDSHACVDVFYAPYEDFRFEKCRWDIEAFSDWFPGGHYGEQRDKTAQDAFSPMPRS